MPNPLILNADIEKHKISRHIYGHFAEHLGRCIYEGLWVGPDSPIPADLLRLSVGIEAVEDLWQDLDQAIRQSNPDH